MAKDHSLDVRASMEFLKTAMETPELTEGITPADDAQTILDKIAANKAKVKP